MEEEKRVDFLLRYIDILGNVPNGTYFNTINLISDELNKALGVGQEDSIPVCGGYGNQRIMSVKCKKDPSIQCYNKNDEK